METTFCFSVSLIVTPWDFRYKKLNHQNWFPEFVDFDENNEKYILQFFQLHHNSFDAFLIAGEFLFHMYLFFPEELIYNVFNRLKLYHLLLAASYKCLAIITTRQTGGLLSGHKPLLPASA